MSVIFAGEIELGGWSEYCGVGQSRGNYNAWGHSMFSFSILYVVSEWVIRLVMTPIVIRRRSPHSALSWLVVIFFLPWIGLLFYMLVGGRRLGRRRVRRHARVRQALSSMSRMAAQEKYLVRPGNENGRAFVCLPEDVGGMPILGGNNIELLADSDEAIDRLIDDINVASDHIHLLFYIFGNGPVGKRVGEAMAKAVERGVKCRLLVDAVGSRSIGGAFERWMTDRGIEVHFMLPVNPLRRRLHRIDLRNHRKLVVIDGRVGYGGSQNIVEASYGHKDMEWHDMMVRVTGPGVLQLQLVFIEDWNYQTGESLDEDTIFPIPERCGDVLLQVVPSGATQSTEPLLHLIVEAIDSARQHIIITSPYFVPDEASMLALRLAVRRGVQVDLVLPERTDHPLLTACARAYYDDLLEAGVNVYLHQKGLLHAKTISIDDSLAMVGSANFDIRSFFLNFELNLLMYGPYVTGRLRFMQQHYIDGSARLEQAEWEKRSGVVSTFENIVKLLSPLL